MEDGEEDEYPFSWGCGSPLQASSAGGEAPVSGFYLVRCPSRDLGGKESLSGAELLLSWGIQGVLGVRVHNCLERLFKLS